jgi:hypothetical protein
VEAEAFLTRPLLERKRKKHELSVEIHFVFMSGSVMLSCLGSSDSFSRDKNTCFELNRSIPHPKLNFLIPSVCSLPP